MHKIIIEHYDLHCECSQRTSGILSFKVHSRDKSFLGVGLQTTSLANFQSYFWRKYK